MKAKEYYLAVRQGLFYAECIFESHSGTYETKYSLLRQLINGLTEQSNSKNNGTFSWDEEQKRFVVK